MASFSICPLIDQNSFLGISDDSTPGCIIVSLGKKMIIRFRLSDQKQLSSWTTRDKLSTPVFYDADRQEYFAVFNGEIISRWTKEKKNLSKNSGRYYFPWVIHSIHCLPGIRPVLLFNSGALAFLGTESKKSITILRNKVLPLGEILETKAFGFSNSHYLCFLIKEDEKLVFKFSPISESSEGEFDIAIVKNGSNAQLCCFTVLEDKGYLMTLWTDGCLHQYDLSLTVRNSEDFPGRCLTSFTCINCSSPCAMLSIDDHIAIYGADSNGEGAKVLWVDARFGIIQNSLHLKLYSNPPRMWKAGNSYLITLVGQSLTVIPYKLKSVPRLDSLLAAHSPTESNIKTAVWEKRRRLPSSPADKDNVISKKLNDGFPECLVSEELIVQCLEKGKLEEVLNYMNTLTDIPDKCVVNTVVACLLSKNKDSHTDILLKALSFPLLNDTDTVAYIREKLSFELALVLLGTIASQLSNNPGSVDLLKWLALLLDSHYQQYLLVKDETVVTQLTSLKVQIDNLVTEMSELQELYKILSGTLKTRITSKSVVHYTVDKFILY